MTKDLLFWCVVAGFLYILYLLAEVLALFPWPTWHWFPALAYGLFAFCLLGCIARFFPKLTPYHWRPMTLLVGAVLSAVTSFMGNADKTGQQHIDHWMTALIGIAMVTILARFSPKALQRFWFGKETPLARPVADSTR
ncbi:MAG: hypothetical protein K0041_00370 [Acidithiobacillus sp.]|nr:hypothetical protein [Acidithiobacillus sp.]